MCPWNIYVNLPSKFMFYFTMAEVLRNGVVQSGPFTSSPTFYRNQNAEVRIITEIVDSDTWYHMRFPDIDVTIKAAPQVQGLKFGAVEGSSSTQVFKGL